MERKSVVSAAKSLLSLMCTHVDRCFNADNMGSHLPFLRRAKQGWNGLPQYPQRAFQKSIYTIMRDGVASRNNLPPGFHVSALSLWDGLTPYLCCAAWPWRRWYTGLFNTANWLFQHHGDNSERLGCSMKNLWCVVSLKNFVHVLGY